MKGRINKKVSCFLVGEDSMADRCMKAILESGYDLLGVCSPTENVVAFAEQKGIPHTNSLQVLKDRMRETECDFLFSISNTRILDKELIELPRVFSINYHNAPLPKYAGVHATSQAILNDERVHGATWHVIEEGVDTGDILKQVIVDVDNEDTNFTLDMKCMEKSISSFRELLDELKNGTYTKTKQDMSLRSYYTMYQKPENFAVISGEFSAQDVYRIYRATSFLGYANRMTLPKFVIKDLVFFAQKIDILDKKGRYPAGTLVEISKDYLRISTKTNDIALSHLRNFNNVEYSAQEFAEMYNLREGDQLTSFDPDFLRRLREQAELLAKHEPFWVRVLEKVVGLNFWIPTSPGAKTSFFREITVFSEDLLEKLSLLFENADARTILETLLLVYLYRLNGCENYSLGYRTKYRGAEKTDVFFEDTVPMNVVFTPETDFEQALVFVADLFGKTDSRLTFSRDITLRYPQLTDHTTPLPIAVGTVRPEKFDADLFFEIKDRSIIVHTCDKLNEIGHRIVENIFGH
ncbi:MAG: hypothetical protein LBJ96_01015, partial [Holosporaceae bacterium]|nr:hypothetical protein [Holosporaceae bacterium]